MNLVVDLDGTILKTDLLYETLFKFLKHNPLKAFLLPFWLLKGRAYLKRQIANAVTIDPTSMPYNLEILKYIEKQRQNGARVYLVTASDEMVAQPIFYHLEIFDEVHGSNGIKNLKGKEKAQFCVNQFGENNFSYIGNSNADFYIWEKSKSALPVGSNDFIKRVSKRFNVEKSFSNEGQFVKALFKSLRLHQWAKNFLVFLPLFLSGHVLHLNQWSNVLISFLSFSFCASSVYILNDMLDVEDDRKHFHKKSRPFASGNLQFSDGLMLVPILLLISLAMSFSVGPLFQIILGIYYILTLLYSLKLKSLLLWDVVTLSILYTLRIIAGGAAIAVPISPWLLAFSVFFFLGLAFVKRVSELVQIKAVGQKAKNGRGYLAVDIPVLTAFGISSGMVSVLVFAFYISSDVIKANYSNPNLLWLACLFLILWLGRVWILTLRDEMHHDPVVFALKDFSSHLMALGVIIIFVCAYIGIKIT